MMNRHILILITIVIIASLYGQESVSINGYLQTENRLRIENKTFTWNENRLNLQLEGAPSDQYHYFSEIRLRGFGFPDVNQASDLQRQEKNKVYTWGLEFREAYIDLYGFGSENLDLRIGRQIVSWGTADAFNPTSRMSPDDLEDIYNFGEKLGTNAISANYYWGDNLTISGVFVPIFTPATFPTGDFSDAFAPPMDLPPGLTLGSISDQIILPDRTVSNSSQYAFKFASNLFNYDVSLSYFKGRDYFPLVSEVTLTPVDTIGTIDISTVMVYPELEMLGGDFAGSIGSVGVWGEGALTYPKKVNMVTISPSFIAPGQMDTIQTTALDDKPYFKFVLGSDYTFKNGLYFNMQYIRGFIHERGKDNLNDYFAFRLEKKFFNDVLKVTPIGGALAINDWNDAKNNYGLAYAPTVGYQFSDNVELSLGAFILDGKGTNLFGSIKDKDEVFFKVKMSF